MPQNREKEAFGKGGAPSPGHPSRSGKYRGAVRLSLRGNDLVITAAHEPGSSEVEPVALRETLSQAIPDGRLLYDQRLQAYRALPGAFRSVRESLARGAYEVTCTFEPAPSLPFEPRVAQEPRTYQSEALSRWQEAGRRGVVVLPTGAGKTLVALLAIQACRVSALIAVPTLDLLEQWRLALLDVLKAPPEHVATFGGGRRDLAPLTVMTYDSASIHTTTLNRFGLLIFDEVHHLPADTYRRIAEGAVASYRLGLSATPDRTDGREKDLDELVGPPVYARSARDLRRFLAAFREERIAVPLDPEEKERYDAARAIYREFIRRRRIRITSPEDFQRWVIWPSAADPEARQAMLAHQDARRLSFNASGKLRVLSTLLERHAGERVIIFSEFNSVVADVSRAFLIPSITHRTPATERQSVLDGFRNGRFTKLVTGRVLNEGVDVPDASVAVVLSGTATHREYVQRLGRVLRPKEREAVLYELVSEETSEMNVTQRRHAPATRT